MIYIQLSDHDFGPPRALRVSPAWGLLASFRLHLLGAPLNRSRFQLHTVWVWAPLEHSKSHLLAAPSTGAGFTYFRLLQELQVSPTLGRPGELQVSPSSGLERSKFHLLWAPQEMFGAPGNL